MKNYKIVWFFIFAVIFTFIAGGVGSALADEANPDHGVIILVAVQLSPTLSLLLLCLLSKNFMAFRKMNWGLSGVKWTWLIVSILIPAAIVCGSAALLSALGFLYAPSVYGNSIPMLIIIPLTVVGIIGEEIGWRGFMMPTFGEKHSLLLSAIFTGFLWGAWHFMKIQSFGIFGYLLFILLCIEFSILMAWVFTKTKHSLLPMIAFHFAVNTCSMFLIYDREGIPFYIAGVVIGGILCGAAIFTSKAKFLQKIGGGEA